MEENNNIIKNADKETNKKKILTSNKSEATLLSKSNKGFSAK